MKKLLLLLCLLSSGILAQNWFPLNIGNSWDYYTNYKIIGGINWITTDVRYITRTRVLDTMTIDSKIYYKIRSYPRWSGDLWFRYDGNEKKIFIRENNTDQLFMNFNLVGGNMFLQYVLNGNYRSAMCIETIFDTTNFIILKGYTVYPASVENYNYFYPDIGFYRTIELTNSSGVPFTNLNLIEYRLITPNNDTIHYKHNHKVQLTFNPKNYLPNLPRLQDTIFVQHYYSDPYHPIYIDSIFFEYYYSDGNNSTVKSRLLLPPLTRVSYGKFRTILNFEIDTVKYQNGYHLYYRIGAKDSGIVPTYTYVPDTGYIKLYWRDSISSVNNDEMLVTNFYLFQNYPNPFNPSTKISWQSPVSGWQTIKVYDILGNEIATLVDEFREAGRYEVEFNVTQTISLCSGVYFYQLRVTEPSSSSGQVFVETKKMILLR